MASKQLFVFLLLICLNYLVSATYHYKHSITGDLASRRESVLWMKHAGDNDTTTTHKNATYPKPAAKYGPFYMQMPLDHFNNASAVTFDNRYWVNADYYKSNGPIILYNVGESAADRSAIFVIDSTMAQLAEKLNGIVVIMEHRFYGTSGPNVTTFFDHTKEDLATFNTKQALADMSYLIKNIQFKNIAVPPVPRTKAVVYGCSYSGSLAAWVRETYPDIFFAAVSSSAPVEAQIDFYQYFDPIMRYGPRPCIQALQNVIAYVDQILFGNSTAEVKALKKMFHAENLFDESFAELLTGDFSGYWQYGINSTYNAFDDIICSYFPKTNAKNDTTTALENLESYSKYVNWYSQYQFCDNETTVLEECLVESNFTVTNLDSVTDNDAAWTWQTCNEFGYYQVAAPENLPTIVSRKFGINYFNKMCQAYFNKFGVPTTPNVGSVNSEYHGWNVQLNRTIWIDGEWDSWRELSVNALHLHRDFTSDDQSLSIIVPKSTHCANVDPVNDDSTQFLKDILNQQYRTLKLWLATGSY